MHNFRFLQDNLQKYKSNPDKYYSRNTWKKINLNHVQGII